MLLTSLALFLDLPLYIIPKPSLILSPHNYSDNLEEQLYLASRDGRDQEVLELLQRGAPPNNFKHTLIMWKRAATTNFYLEQGGRTPLHMACANNHICSAEALIKFGAIVGAEDNDGWTPLHSACRNNSKGTAKLLLEHHCPTSETIIIILHGY